MPRLLLSAAAVLREAALNLPDLLVLGAFPPEIATLAGRLPAGVVAATCGVGLVEAALGAARELRATGAKNVVFLGTCGAFEGAGLAVLDVVTLARTRLASAGAAEGLAALPEPMTREVVADAPLTAALAPGAVAVTVASTLALTVDDEAARALAHTTGAAAEHLEAFAVGLAAEQAGARFAAVLGVANLVGSRGREQWRANHQEASRRAAEALLAGLGGHAGGRWRLLLQGAPPSKL